jgi:hypothetical protein
MKNPKNNFKKFGKKNKMITQTKKIIMENKTQTAGKTATESIGVTEMQPMEWIEEMEEHEIKDFYDFFQDDAEQDIGSWEDFRDDYLYEWAYTGFFDGEGKAKINRKGQQRQGNMYHTIDSEWASVTWKQEDVERVLKEKIKEQEENTQ